MIGRQLWPMIERVNVRSSAGRIKEDDPIGFRSVMAIACRQWISRLCWRISGSRLKFTAQARQRDGTEATGCAVKEFAT